MDNAYMGANPNQIIEPKEGLLQKTPIYEIKLIFGFALTIICLALSLSAYTKLQEISSDVYDITENWETQPVISVYVPMSVDEPCPDGYSVISLEKSDFPGITKGSCGCTPNVEGYVSTAANCSDSAEPTNYCMSMPPQGEVRSSKWRNSNICYQRGGESAASWATGYIRRPYPDGEGRCPDGYRKCGVGASYEDGAICFPVDSQCPITGMLVTPHDEPPPLSGHWHPAGELDGNFTLFVRRQFPGEMPIVDLELHLTEYTSNDYLDGVSYDADNNKRGPCYTGRKQVFSDSDVVSDQEILWAYSVNYPTSCRKEDKRFTLFDRRDSQSHFLETIGRESEYCEGLQLYALSDPRYNVSSDPDYVNSRIPCGTDGFVCGRDSYQYTDCADEICDVVVNQNICGLYTRAARSLADSTQTFGMYRRGEIIWRETCVVTQDQIYRNVDPLEAAVKAQLAGVVLSFVFGIVFGIVIPVVGLVVSENTTGKFRVHSQFELLLIQVDPYVHMCKLGPIVAAIIFISQIYRLYAAVGGDSCSDPTTNATFDYLGKTLPSIYQTSLANVLIECMFVLMAFYSSSQYITGNESGLTKKITPEEMQMAAVNGNGRRSLPCEQCCTTCCCCGCLCSNKHAHPRPNTIVPTAELVNAHYVQPFSAPVYGAPPVYAPVPQGPMHDAPPALSGGAPPPYGGLPPSYGAPPVDSRPPPSNPSHTTNADWEAPALLDDRPPPQ